MSLRNLKRRAGLVLCEQRAEEPGSVPATAVGSELCHPTCAQPAVKHTEQN